MHSVYIFCRFSGAAEHGEPFLQASRMWRVQSLGASCVPLWVSSGQCTFCCRCPHGCCQLAGNAVPADQGIGEEEGGKGLKVSVHLGTVGAHAAWAACTGTMQFA